MSLCSGQLKNTKNTADENSSAREKGEIRAVIWLLRRKTTLQRRIKRQILIKCKTMQGLYLIMSHLVSILICLKYHLLFLGELIKIPRNFLRILLIFA